MRIVIDMQGAQTVSRFRGIGRYTLNFTKALVRNRGRHEIYLVLNGLFTETIQPIRFAFDKLLPQENIRVFSVPGPVKDIDSVNKIVLIGQSDKDIAKVISDYSPDIIAISVLFSNLMESAGDIARLAKKINKQIKIIIGGNCISNAISDYKYAIADKNSNLPDYVSSLEEENFDAFTMYPNPTAGATKMEFAEGGDYTIEVLDMTGSRVISIEESVNANETIEFDMSHYPMGVYMVNVKGDRLNKTVKLTVK